jgi:hypothetical protein
MGQAMTPTNKLILLAARAASIDLAWTSNTSYGDCWMLRGTNEPWNPIVDSGDCWRLQCAMRMGLVYTNTTVQARWYDHTAKAERFGAQQNHTQATLEAAARMAIVSAAAAIEEAYEQLECCATGQGHAYTPCGPHQGIQCCYCGAPPPVVESPLVEPKVCV